MVSPLHSPAAVCMNGPGTLVWSPPSPLPCQVDPCGVTEVCQADLILIFSCSSSPGNLHIGIAGQTLRSGRFGYSTKYGSTYLALGPTRRCGYARCFCHCWNSTCSPTIQLPWQKIFFLIATLYGVYSVCALCYER